MSDSPASIHLQRAMAAKTRRENRVTSDVIRAFIGDFLNSDEGYLENVGEKLYHDPDKAASAVVASVSKVIDEDMLGDLVTIYNAKGTANATLVKLAGDES